MELLKTILIIPFCSITKYISSSSIACSSIEAQRTKEAPNLACNCIWMLPYPRNKWRLSCEWFSCRKLCVLLCRHAYEQGIYDTHLVCMREIFRNIFLFQKVACFACLQDLIYLDVYDAFDSINASSYT